MTRMLSEAEAWREIAMRHENRAIYPSNLRLHRCAGLCIGVANLCDEHVIARKSASAMKERIEEHGHAWSGRGFAWYWPQEEWDVRVLAALFLALECEDEAKAAKRRAA